jgi:DNA invertase Pin-like site-specific DNA recombinase
LFVPRTKNLPLSEIFGYARVSTSDQETTLQLDALHRAGVYCIYQEKRSSVGRRPQLDTLLSVLSPGAIVKVYKIDRFARSLIDLLSILERIEAAGASFQSLTEPIDTSTPAGRMMMHMLGAFAEFERSIIRERSMAGQRAAKERGAHCGRPRGLTEKQESKLVKMYNSQKYTIDALALIFECHPSTAKRAIYRVNKPTSSSLT